MHPDIPQNTDNAPTLIVLRELLRCALSWHDDVRLIGNIRAKDMIRAFDEAISAMEDDEK